MKNIVISLTNAKEPLIWILAWLAAKGYTRIQKLEQVISISSKTYILWGTYILWSTYTRNKLNKFEI